MRVVEAADLRAGDVVLRPSKGERWAAGPLTVASVTVEATFATIHWIDQEHPATVPMTTQFDVED